MIVPFFQGLGTGAGLIIAIGPQNTFVLTQAVKRQHPITVASICVLCDAVLIGCGVGGVGTVLAGHPLFTSVSTWIAALFLFGYGLKACISAWRGHNSEEKMQPDRARSWSAVALITLALTLLNPHVYVDTILLLGTIGGRLAPDARLSFAIGAVTASTVWFFALSLGGRLLSPLFRRPIAWRIMEICVASIMWTIATSLLFWN